MKIKMRILYFTFFDLFNCTFKNLGKAKLVARIKAMFSEREKYGIYVQSHKDPGTKKMIYHRLCDKEMSGYINRNNEVIVALKAEMEEFQPFDITSIMPQYVRRKTEESDDNDSFYYINKSKFLQILNSQIFRNETDIETVMCVSKNNKYSAQTSKYSLNTNTNTAFCPKATDSNNEPGKNLEINNDIKDSRGVLAQNTTKVNENNDNIEKYKKEISDFITGYIDWNGSLEMIDINKKIKANKKKIMESKISILKYLEKIEIPKEIEKEVRNGDCKYLLLPNEPTGLIFVNNDTIDRMKKDCKNTFILKIIKKIKVIPNKEFILDEKNRFFLDSMVFKRRDFYTDEFLTSKFVFLDFSNAVFHLSEIIFERPLAKNMNKKEMLFVKYFYFSLSFDRIERIEIFLKRFGIDVPHKLNDRMDYEFCKKSKFYPIYPIKIEDGESSNEKTERKKHFNKQMKSGNRSVYGRLSKDDMEFIHVRDQFLDRLGCFKNFFVNKICLPRTLELTSRSRKMRRLKRYINYFICN